MPGLRQPWRPLSLGHRFDSRTAVVLAVVVVVVVAAAGETGEFFASPEKSDFVLSVQNC